MPSFHITGLNISDTYLSGCRITTKAQHPASFLACCIVDLFPAAGFYANSRHSFDALVYLNQAVKM